MLDTDVLVELQLGNKVVATLFAADRVNAVSIITYLEFIQGSRSQSELKENRVFFQEAQIQVLPLTPEIGYRAAALVEGFYLRQNLLFPDALIAATAIEHGLVLVTGNLRHYRGLPKLILQDFNR